MLCRTLHQGWARMEGKGECEEEGKGRGKLDWCDRSVEARALSTGTGYSTTIFS